MAGVIVHSLPIRFVVDTIKIGDNLPEWTPATFQQRFPIFSGFFPTMPPALPIWNACAGLMGSHVQNVKSSMSPIDLRREPPLS